MAFCCANTRKTPKKPKKSYQHLKPNRWSVLLDIGSFIPTMTLAVYYMTWLPGEGVYAVVAAVVLYALLAIQQLFMPSRIVGSFLLRACVMGGLIAGMVIYITSTAYAMVVAPIALAFLSLSAVYYLYRICSFKRPPPGREDAVAPPPPLPADREEEEGDVQGSDSEGDP